MTINTKEYGVMGGMEAEDAITEWCGNKDVDVVKYKVKVNNNKVQFSMSTPLWAG